MKTAIITGGTGAIGSALVSEFAADYNVVFTYLKNKEKAGELADKFGAVPVLCDLSDLSQIHALDPFLGECALLINNAGIAQIKLFGDTTDDELRRVTDTDLVSAMALSREAARGMIHRKAGCIINISSVWGVYGASCEVAYSAAKAGIIGFTKALAKELGPSGIRVNCIAPGVIESPMNAHLNDEELRELIEATPLMRLGKPGDVAHAARFFEQNTFTTAQILGVDGGFC
jgi:3-oxoacyl-[acyl-carrier protein] reductase